MHYTDKDRKTPPPQPVLFSLYEEEPGGRLPASLAEPPRPHERVQRHTMEQLADVPPMVPSLAVPEPQMVNQLGGHGPSHIRLCGARADYRSAQDLLAIPLSSYGSP